MALETLEIDGKTAVVIHISEDNRRARAMCTGMTFDIPPENDNRPRTLCDKCRIKFRDGK